MDDREALTRLRALVVRGDAALGNGPSPLLHPMPVDLEEVSMILEGDPVQGSGRIDLTTGEVWPQSALDYVEEIGEAEDDDPDRWLWVNCEGPRSAYQDMVSGRGAAVVARSGAEVPGCRRRVGRGRRRGQPRSPRPRRRLSSAADCAVSTPLLHLLAGPNGSGKSTFVTEVLQPATHLPLVNVDLIDAQLWPDAKAEHAHEASRAAADERSRLMAARAPFITEMVFNHPSKVDLVAKATTLGYVVHLHVVLVPESLPVARVAARVAQGGHDVPTEKIRERYARLWPLVAVARNLADRSTFYDNTRAARPFRVVATYERARLFGEPAWPVWTHRRSCSHERAAASPSQPVAGHHLRSHLESQLLQYQSPISRRSESDEHRRR